jgi:activator of the mannose operon (transcriptional antiterminator)
VNGIIKLTQRQSHLMFMLMKQLGYRTIKDYAESLNCSERTIHSDLRIIESFLVEKGYELEKRPGIGIRANKLAGTSSSPEPVEMLDDSTLGRRKKIMELLLFEGKTLTFEALSELFIVSRSSIKNDLMFVEKRITNRNRLKLASDCQGTRLAGTEKDMQRGFIEFNRSILQEDNPFFANDDDRNLTILASYYGKDVVNVCSRVLYGYVKKEAAAIAEYYVFNVLSMMIVQVYRMMNGFHLEDQEDSADIDENAYFWQGARGMLDTISLRLNIGYTTSDVKHLSAYLVSNKFAPLPSEQKYSLWVDKILKKAGASLAFDFTKDEKLAEQLILHVPPMIYRLRAGIQTNNPFIYHIKNEFPLIFNVIWVVLGEYEDELEVAFNEEEVGFLTIYFQSAIERSKVGKKIMVICPRGIATSELLLNRIKNVLPAFDSFEVASAREAARMDLTDIDLIISTVELDLPHPKVAVVSPLLNEQDIKNISDLYHATFVLKKEIKNDGKPLFYLSRYIHEPFIMFDSVFQSRDELINEIGDRLITEGYVAPGFIESVKNREMMGGTDLPTGAAIPHGNPKFVNKTIIVFVRNKKNVTWNKTSVRTVILICISEEDTRHIRHILTDIYRIIENKEVLNQIYMMSDKREFIKRIGCGMI